MCSPSFSPIIYSAHVHRRQTDPASWNNNKKKCNYRCSCIRLALREQACSINQLVSHSAFENKWLRAVLRGRGQLWFSVTLTLIYNPQIHTDPKQHRTEEKRRTREWKNSLLLINVHNDCDQSPSHLQITHTHTHRMKDGAEWDSETPVLWPASFTTLSSLSFL